MLQVFLSAPVDGAGSTFLKHFYNDLVKKKITLSLM